MAKIDSFRAFITDGGVRPSQFKVELGFPTAIDAAEGTSRTAGIFLVKATSLPASTITPIEVPWRGRMAKVAGERVFQNWSVTIINDGGFLIRSALERWSNLIIEHESTNGTIPPNSYTAEMSVTQLDRNDLALRKYTMANCWPANIGEIQLDFGNTNSIEEYQVEFSVDYWTANDLPTTGQNASE